MESSILYIKEGTNAKENMTRNMIKSKKNAKKTKKNR